MNAGISAAYAQLLSLGVIWISLHCSGMCGPLVLGLGLGRSAPGRSPRWALLQVLAYQSGKAVIYAGLGALAGLMGRTVGHALTLAGPWLSGGLGLVILATTLVHRFRAVRAAPGAGAALGRLLAWVERTPRRPLVRAFSLGLAMAALPCMLVVWVLALAAGTQSPLHGALVMLLLVAMNSVPLLGVVHLAGLVRQRAPRAASIQPWLTAVSGIWLLLVAAAASGHFPHASLPLQIGGKGFVVMFW